MASITVKVDNGKVRQSLTTIGQALPRITDKRVWRMMMAARDEVRTYPAPLPGQRYKRTGKRYAATNVYRVDNKTYRLDSNPTYRGRTANPYVVGDSQGKGQAWMHRGRWAVMFAVVSKWVKTLLREIETDIADLLRREGMGL